MDNMTKKLATVQQLLKITYGIVPIVAGADKFFNILTDWTQYLSPTLAGMLPVSSATIMTWVGIVEIIAGILVFVKPAVGGLIVSAWLLLISVMLLASGLYLDVAVRDLVIAVGAFAFARLSTLELSKNPTFL